MIKSQQYYLLFLLLMLFLPLTNAKTQTAMEMMGQANDLYEMGKMKEALQLYQKIEAEGQESAQLYLNMGNAWFKSDSLAPSILAYERGLRLKPSDVKLQHNLDFAKQNIALKADTYPDIFYKKFLKNRIKSLAAWKWLALAAVLAWLVLGLFYRFLTKRNRRNFVGGIVLFGLAMCCLIAFFVKNQWETEKKEAILFGNVVQIKEAPADGSQTQFKLSAGNKLKIGESLNGWTKVYFEDGKEGWIETQFLVVI